MPTGSAATVVIPAYNEEAIIETCLEALCRQDTTEPFDVIVVDNRSSDRTGEKAGAFAGRLALTVLREEKPGRGAARAAGFAAARGDVIFSTDADAVVPPDWLSSHLRELAAHPEAAAVTGPARIEDLSPWKNALLTRSFPLYIRIGMFFMGYTCMNGFNFSVRREAYAASGGFDPEADAQEDMDLTLRVRKHGKIRYVSTAPIISGRRFREGLFKAWFEYAKTFWLRFVCGRRRVRLRNVK